LPPNRPLAFLRTLRFCRQQSATPVFIIPDEIVPGAVSVKDLPDLIDAARKKTRGAARGKLLGLV
jgi:hypothetical protein